MIISARYQAIIELLTTTLSNPVMPTNQIVQEFLKKRHYIGSHDRQHITDTLYHILRNYYSLKSIIIQNNPRLMLLAFLRFYQEHPLKKIMLDWNEQSPFAPKPLTLIEQKFLQQSVPMTNIECNWLLPFFQSNFPNTFEKELQTLTNTPNLDLRFNPLKTDMETILQSMKKLYLKFTPTVMSPYGIRCEKRFNLQNNKLYLQGLIEVQDEGSQLAAILSDVEPGMKVLDYCAGAGGKTLLMAAMMENKGILVATDIADWRLARAQERLKRSGVFNTHCKVLDNNSAKWLKRQNKQFDRVFVDAPCSGSGTWRRNPDLKIRFTEDMLKNLVEEQSQIITKAAELVKSGGKLIYVTCSMLAVENQSHPTPSGFSNYCVKNIWEKKLPHVEYPSDNPNYLQLTPYQHVTDGFFIRVWQRD